MTATNACEGANADKPRGAVGEEGESTRRRLLAGGAAAIGAGALAVGLGAKRAGAADGGSMLIGQFNQSTLETTLYSDTAPICFRVSTQAANSVGVRGNGSIGVQGLTNNGIAVHGRDASNGVAVKAETVATSGATVGVQASVKSPAGYGVLSDAGPGTAGKFMGWGTGQPVQLVLELESDTAPQQIFKNASTGAKWFFAMTSDDEFKISKDGTGKVEAKFFTNGNLQIAGTLIQASDVAVKTNIEPADTQAVLDAIAEMEILTWEYDADEGVTHLGPTSQGFKAAFGLGAADTGIASVDADGVAFAAIQALNHKLEKENMQLRGEVGDVRDELTALRTMVEQMVR